MSIPLLGRVEKQNDTAHMSPRHQSRHEDSTLNGLRDDSPPGTQGYHVMFDDSRQAWQNFQHYWAEQPGTLVSGVQHSLILNYKRHI